VTADGTVFTLTPPTKRGGNWREKILHFFVNNGTGGAFPEGLAFDSEGNLCGPATEAGKYGSGEILRLKAPSKAGEAWTYGVLYNFRSPPDGVDPAGYLTFDQSGNLYGVTELGGTGNCQEGGCGTVFEFTP